MLTSLFDFHLPPENIALRPAVPRESAKLLCIAGGLQDKIIADLPLLLNEKDLLVFNNTKVFPAELEGKRQRGENIAKISLNLHKRIDGASWLAFARPAKKVLVGEVLTFADGFNATVTAKNEGEIELHFNLQDAELFQAFEAYGKIPLPPYISGKRALDAQDKTDYQTSFAKFEGSVAAPTAGLHFTPELLAAIRQRGVRSAFVTLHVGAGTFLPMKAQDTSDHKMHAEWGEVLPDVIEAIAQTKVRGGRVIAVGTTSLRLLEAANNKIFQGETDIFITPSYKFNTIDALITNFHLPKSTLFMLVCALAGHETMLKAYEHAILQKYRFYSYGDACFLELGQYT